MLAELSIRDFAIIPKLTLSFQDGLIVLTGETGAGKSIIMDAIALLVGGRSSVDYIRFGKKKAEIEGLFVLDEDHPVLQLLPELGIDKEENTVILRRDISSQGKSICRINGKLVTLAILREIGQALVDIHGQHEHQLLLHEEKYLSLLDEYGKDLIDDHKHEFTDLFQRYKKLNEQIKHLTEGEQQLVQRLDLVRFQLEEINNAQLEIGEDERLLQEKRKISHSQKIFAGVDSSYEALSGDGKSLDLLGYVMNELDELAQIDDELRPSLNIVENAFYQLEDVSHQLSKYKSQIEFEPDRLNQIETRLMEIDLLKRKYGREVSTILEYAAKIEDELDSIENKEERIEELQKKRDDIALDLAVEAKNLTKIRAQIAQNLVEQIKSELKGLYMDKTEIQIQLSAVTSGEKIVHENETRFVRQDGWDDIQFLISTNPGEPVKPLSKIASGGELARLMLALKSVFAQIEPVTTLIFDEVDTGVSGRVVQAMAEKLYLISRGQQVLCITHHAQVAAMSDEHFYIKKEMTDIETTTNVIPLDSEASADEISRMMSGVKVTTATKHYAVELMESAETIKQELKEKLSI
jgi:DNA repair protein RecN (Recombination protein N)